MGFLDMLFGGGDDSPEEAELEFSEVKGWLDGWFERFNREKVKKARPVVEEVDRIISGLERDVQHLGSLKVAKNVDKRFAKVVRTNKPAYVEGMSRIVKALKDGLDDSDLRSYSDVLEENLESIAKVNVGDGRYLGAVYPEELQKIQTKCKQLLDSRDMLKEIMEPGEDEKELIAVREEYEGLSEDLEGLDGLRKSLEDSENHLREETAHVGEMRERLEEVVERLGTGEVKALRDGLGSAEKGLKGVESLIHSSIAGLARGLRKFSRHSLPDSKLVERILEDSVEGFLESDIVEFQDMLGRFETSVDEGKVRLKDREKVLARIKGVRETLTADVKEQHAKLNAEVREMRSRLDAVDAFKEERTLREKIKSGESRMEGFEEEIGRLGGEAEGKAEDVKERMASFAEELREHNVTIIYRDDKKT
ncbi:MAG: hypothetical protein GF416_00145 [Candidatus Altiarchaeales archaeon]|nr:hypothetical protein [Candidatus Altiarchaeales archaeon]MBD3415531.1 hypothetical protein [Candidatus Altiarchaeales archaeon]